MNSILAFLIFSGVIATGNAKSCITCEATGIGANDCQGEIEECDEGVMRCAAQIEYNDLNVDNKVTVKKRCLPESLKDYCGNRFKLNADVFNITVYTECCNNMDGCNTNPIQMPEDDATPNGLQCLTCFAEGSTTCDSPVLRPCFGNQLQCFNFKGDAARPGEATKQYAIKGCITQYACYLDLDGLPGTRVYSKDYTCT